MNFDYGRTETPVPRYRSAGASRGSLVVAGLKGYMRVARAELKDDEGMVLGTIYEPLAENIAAIREVLRLRGYVALFRNNPDWRSDADAARHIIRFGPDPLPPAQAPNPAVNIVLFLLTVFTTLLIGSLQQNGNPFFLRDLSTSPYVQQHYYEILRRSLSSPNPLNLGELLLGLPFSLALLLILGSHELGHYLTARRHGVDATLPYFLPIPHPLMGTMGAFIRIRSPIPDRRALIRLGAAGPITGFLFAVPITVIGLMLSEPVELASLPGGISLGSSLLFGWLSQLFFPNLAPGYDIMLHPLAFAGWLGFFVTALNLIPLGQLDGGHIAYALLGRTRNVFRFLVLALLFGLGFIWSGWFFWSLLVLILGLHHPPTQDEVTPLTARDKLLVVATAVVFVLSFIPVPFPRAG